jgi:DNA-binding IclR family transcriptional regulator
MPRSADRAFEILEAVAVSKKGLKHGDISRTLNIPKGSLSKLLSDLIRREYLSLDATSKTYALGPQVLFLANAYLAGIDIIHIAQPIIREVMIKTRESASLYIKRGEDGLIVCKENSPHVVMTRINVGDRVPLYATGGGKAILAFLEEEEIETYLSSVSLKPLTPNTITDPKALRRELKTIRDRGLARSNGEQFEDLIGIGAPIFGWDGRVVASISTPIPRSRFTVDNEKNIEKVLHESSIEISRELGLSRNSQPSS